MADQLPPDGDQIRDRIIANWIFARDSVDGQADGLQAIATAFWDVLALITGAVATRAVLHRSLAQAAREHPIVNTIQVVDGGLDLTQFRSQHGSLSPEDSRVLLASVVDALVVVLYRLVGNVLVPLLREVEDELARMKGPTTRSVALNERGL